MKRLVWVVAVLAATALVAGCGGGSSSSGSSTSESTTTRSAASEYAAQGNAICRQAEETLDPLLEEFERLASHGLTTPARRAEAAGVVRRGIPGLAAEQRAFEGLSAPAGLESTESRLITGIGKEVALEEAFAKALASGSAHELEAVFARIAKNELAVRGAAIHLGLNVCGKILRQPGTPHANA